MLRAADVDADGNADLLFTVIIDKAAGTGASRVLYGPLGGYYESAAATLSFAGTAEFAVNSAVGDATGDGLPEIVINDPTDATNGAAAGALFLIDGTSL